MSNSPDETALEPKEPEPPAIESEEAEPGRDSDEEEQLEHFVEHLVGRALDKEEGPRNFYRAWTPEVASQVIKAFQEIATGKNTEQARQAGRRAMLQWTVQGLVLLAIIGAIVYLSATHALEAAGAGALGTLAGYLMGRRGG